MGWPLRRLALARSSGVRDSGSLNVATRHAIEGEQRRGDARGPRADVVAERTADGRAEHEAQAERHPDHAHALGAVRRGRHVGDVRLRGRDVGGEEARERARDEEEGQPAPDARRAGVEEVRDRVAREREREDGLAADAVGEVAPHRREDELREGVGGDQQPGLERRGAVVGGVPREQRDDHPEPEQVDEDRQEHHEDGRLLHVMLPGEGGFYRPGNGGRPSIGYASDREDP